MSGSCGCGCTHAHGSGESGGENLRLRLLLGSSLLLWGAALLAGLSPLGGILPPPVRPALFLIAGLLGGAGTLRRGAASLRALRFDADLLMSLALLGAAALGDFPEAGTMGLLTALSDQLEEWVEGRARRSIRDLLLGEERTATRLDGEAERTVPARSIRAGDRFLLRPGERVAADGIVESGTSEVDLSHLTGEPLPVPAEPGDRLPGGGVNGSGALVLRAERDATDSAEARIVRLVEAARTERAPFVRLLDRFAAVYTPLVGLAAAGTALLPLLPGTADPRGWFLRALALLVASCPCALIVSSPAAVAAAAARAARMGLRFRGGGALEAAGSVRRVAFDKTGTLSRGRPTLVGAIPSEGGDEAELLRIAARIELPSEHPLARATVAAARDRGLDPPPPDSFRALPGAGGEAEFDGEIWRIGGPRLLEERGIAWPPTGGDPAAEAGRGRTLAAVLRGDRIEGILAYADPPRPEAAEAVRSLEAMGVGTLLLSGDRPEAARETGRLVGIADTRGGLSPEEKREAIRALRSLPGGIAMVGDGINDAAALTEASLGVALGSGTDAAEATADLVLAREDLRLLPEALRIGRALLRTLRVNLALALGIKLAVVGAIFAGFASLWLAIAADMGSCLLVTGNALRLLSLPEASPASRPRKRALDGGSGGRE